MKGFVFFGVLILGSLYIIFHPGEVLEDEIELANIQDKNLKSVPILNEENEKDVDYGKNIEIIRKINSEEIKPTDYSDLALLTKKPLKKSASHNRIEAIFGESAPFPEYEFNPKITIPEPNPYPKTPCVAL